MILPVVMAGGRGSRLWPLSRELCPKQFLALNGSHSLLQATLMRLQGQDYHNPLLICGEDHRFIVAEQLRLIHQASNGIILEPIGRNTAPAIALAAFKALNEGTDPLLLVLAADHIIANVDAFHRSVQHAIPHAELGKLVAFGITPTKAEIGYGYIKAEKSSENTAIIKAFIEKPDLEMAQAYISNGDYYWNSGIFMFKASRYLNELKDFRPEIYLACKNAMENIKISDDFSRVDAGFFAACPSDSIDYAIMERTVDAIVVPMSAGWSDIGSWSALWDVCPKDESGNVCHGDIIKMTTNNCYVHGDERLIVTLGLENIVVVDTKDAILIAEKNSVQDVKLVVEELKRRGRSEAIMHREVYRPWGKYESIDQGARYQVKRITVKSGEKLSIQMHHHRAEHWVVVSGTAKVTHGDKTFLLTENQSTYIPVGVIHALENPGRIPLEIIEVQSGAYLLEDDIIRFEDRYGRSSVVSLPEVVAA